MQLNWIDSKDVERLSWVEGRNKFADECQQLTVDEILKKYVYLTENDVKYLISVVNQLHGNILNGVGVELGAGVAIFSAVLSCKPEVQKIYAVELVPRVVSELQPRVIEEYGDLKKAMPTLGSFDEMKLEDGSCDFIIEYDSLHHSFDLGLTLKEAYRVLRPGGVLVAIDRVQPDGLNDSLKQRLLQFEYGNAWLIDNHYDPLKRLTREMNGEHEIRQSEWIDALYRAGFSRVSVTHLTRLTKKMFAYSILTMLPDFIKRKTRYSILSSHVFTDVIRSFFIRNPKPENIGGYIGCLDKLESKQAMIKNLIFAIK
jgi:SAM-dependent methyltransferase